MKNIFYTILTLVFLYPLSGFSQVKFGFRSGIGLFMDVSDYNILSPYDNTEVIFPKESVYGNEIPRRYDKKRSYADAGIKQEAFVNWREKHEVNISFTYVRQPRAYNDLGERYWGENEDHRVIYYQAVYSRKFWEKNKLSFQAGTGLAANKFIVSRAVYSLEQDANGEYNVTSTDFYTSGADPKQFDWGFPLKLQADYNISKNASLGVQSDVIYLLGVGIMEFNLIPILKIQF